MLSPKDYRDAISVQDACNLSGVVFAWALILERMAGMDTNARNHHPINVLFASKVASLTNCEDSNAFHQAYLECVNPGITS